MALSATSRSGFSVVAVFTAALVTVLAIALVLATAAPAAERDYGEDDNGGDRGAPADRRSTWELSTSLTFYRYLEPFARAESARECRDRCVRSRRCTGWTYYDANFRDAGALSYKLQRVCVLGAGLLDKQSGNRPGRTSGVVRSLGARDGDE
jgi:hypothetical protein